MKTPREILAERLSEKMSELVGAPVRFDARDIHSTHSSQRRGMHDTYAWTAFSEIYSVDCYETITNCVRYGFTVARDTSSASLCQYDATGGTKETRR